MVCFGLRIPSPGRDYEDPAGATGTGSLSLGLSSLSKWARGKWWRSKGCMQSRFHGSGSPELDRDYFYVVSSSELVPIN